MNTLADLFFKQDDVIVAVAVGCCTTGARPWPREGLEPFSRKILFMSSDCRFIMPSISSKSRYPLPGGLLTQSSPARLLALVPMSMKSVGFCPAPSWPVWPKRRHHICTGKGFDLLFEILNFIVYLYLIYAIPNTYLCT